MQQDDADADTSDSASRGSYRLNRARIHHMAAATAAHYSQSARDIGNVAATFRKKLVWFRLSAERRGDIAGVLRRLLPTPSGYVYKAGTASERKNASLLQTWNLKMGEHQRFYARSVVRTSAAVS